MIKKWLYFIIVSLILLVLCLIFTNIKEIWESILSLPVDRVICFACGGIVMYAVCNKPRMKSKKKSDK